MENVMGAALRASGSDGDSPNDGASSIELVDPLTGFGTRHALMLALEGAVARENPPALLVVFGLDGFEEYVSLFGQLAGRTLLTKLSTRLAGALEPAGACFRPRYDEFSALIETTIDSAQPVLDTAVMALRERTSSGVITAAWGAALLPDEAESPIAALAVADQRLSSNAPRRRRRNRRSGAPRSA